MVLMLAATSRHILARAPTPRLELGFQFDPAASVGPLFALGGFAALQLKVREANNARTERDAALELARIARKRLLAGDCSVQDVSRAEAAAKQAALDYDDARLILGLPGVLLRVPDPTSSPEAREVADDIKEKDQSNSDAVDQREEIPPTLSRDPLSTLRSSLGLQDDSSSNSLLPSGSKLPTFKDFAIGFVLLLQIFWLLLSFTDPLGRPGQT